jgi:hypothetical protein
LHAADSSTTWIRQEVKPTIMVECSIEAFAYSHIPEYHHLLYWWLVLVAASVALPAGVPLTRCSIHRLWLGKLLLYGLGSCRLQKKCGGEHLTSAAVVCAPWITGVTVKVIAANRDGSNKQEVFSGEMAIKTLPCKSSDCRAFVTPQL